MAFDANSIQPLLEEFVSPRVTKAFEEAAPFVKRLKEGKSNKTNTRGARLVTKIGANPSISWYDSDGGLLPTAGRSKYIEMRVFFKPLVIAGALSKQAMDLNDAGALVDVVMDAISDDMETLTKEIEIAAWEKPDGRRAVVEGVAGGSVVMAEPFTSRRLALEGIYNFYSPSGQIRSGGGFRDCRLRSKIDATGDCSFDRVPSDVQAGDLVTWKGSFGRSLNGIPYHVSNGSEFYQGQPRLKYQNLRSTIYDARGAAISALQIDRAIALNKYKLGIDKKMTGFELWSAPTQYEGYRNNGYSLMRFMESDTYNGTFQNGVKHGKLKWNEVTDCYEDAVYGLRMEHLEWYKLEDMAILKADGQTMRMVPAFDEGGNGSFKSELVYYIGCSGEIGCRDPRQHFAVINLSTTNLPMGKDA